MPSSRRNTEQADRFAGRRTREDEARRLHDDVPRLVSLELRMEDSAGVTGGSKYTRRIVVERAPALFLATCSDSRCQGGEHDLTADVMSALRGGRTSFHGEDACHGSVGMNACPHTLRFDGVAVYRD